jgi:hypothetical protein
MATVEKRSSPQNTRLRWAAVGCAAALLTLADQRGWIADRLTVAFAVIAIAILAPRPGPAMKVVIRMLLLATIVATYTHLDMWHTQPVLRSVAMIAVCTIPIIFDVIDYLDRRKKKITP